MGLMARIMRYLSHKKIATQMVFLIFKITARPSATFISLTQTGMAKGMCVTQRRDVGDAVSRSASSRVKFVFSGS